MATFRDRRRSCTACTWYVDEHCGLGVPDNVIEEPDTFVCARNEIRPPDTIEHNRVPGFYTRGWFDDLGMVSEAMQTASSLGIAEDDVVLDLGAHIGSFGVMALKEGARFVIFCEADPINWPMIDLNTEPYRRQSRAVSIIKKAAVGDGFIGDRVTLWRTRYVGCSSVLWRKRTYRTFVPAIKFSELLDTYRPTVLKVDVEGAEHQYLWNMPAGLRVIHIEVHRMDAQSAEFIGVSAAATGIQQDLEAQGFVLAERKERMAFIALHMRRQA